MDSRIQTKEKSTLVLIDVFDSVLYDYLMINKNEIKLDELGVKLKKYCQSKDIKFVNEKNKIISLNTFIKIHFKNISHFIKHYTKHSIHEVIKIN